MSAPKAANAGYEYQHAATAWLILSWSGVPHLRAQVETGEDVTFSVNVRAVTRTIEVQIKSSNHPADAEAVAQILAHFPPHEDVGCLLERLRDDENKSALLVLAGPCTDTVAPLHAAKPSEALDPRSARALTREQARALLAAFGKVYEVKNPSDQTRRRAAACKGVINRMSADDFREISRRIFILSHLDESYFHDRAAHILQTQFRVPHSAVEPVWLSLAQIVRSAPASDDVAPRVLETATHHGRSMLLSPAEPHIARTEEAALFAYLGQFHVLLLAGVANAGKTRIAQALATRLQGDGYAVELGSDTDAGRRYLTQSSPEDRAFVLEDPFGSVRILEHVHDVLVNLRRLLRDVETHRKLIVTARSDILSAILGSPPWGLEGHIFHDVTMTAPSVAVEIWTAHARDRGIAPPCANKA